MANRTSAALLAALIAVPTGLAAQTATETATETPPVVAPAAPAADTAAPAATDAATDAPAAETPAADAPAAAAAETPAADAPAAAAPTGDAPAAAAGAATPGEQQPGSYYAKETHGDWTLRCMKTPDGKDPCELYQLLKDDQGVAVAEVSAIPFNGKAAALINFVAPLETDLGTGLGLQIDAGKNNAYPFIVCAPIGCISRIGLTEAELGAMKKGNKATVSLLPFGGDRDKNTVKLNLSLTGFTAGYEALKTSEAAAPAATPAEDAAPKN